MGLRGPVPKRSEDRVRRNKVSTAAGVTKGTMKPVTIPDPDPDWHPIATRLYESLAESGQSDFYQQSDWAMAFSICDDLSSYKAEESRRKEQLAELAEWDALQEGMSKAEREAFRKEHPHPSVSRGGSAIKLQSVYSALKDLLVTEADRRRLHIELQEPEDDETPAEVIVMNEYREGLKLNG